MNHLNSTDPLRGRHWDADSIKAFDEGKASSPFLNSTDPPQIPAENFCATLAANVDNARLSDAGFRQLARNTLPDVIYPRPATSVSSEDPPPYGDPLRGEQWSPDEIKRFGDDESVLASAREIIRNRWPKDRKRIDNAEAAWAALEIHYGNARMEMVTLLLLDSGNRLIAIEDVAQGTVDGSAVYPREVLCTVLNFDATGVILAHNHPSGRTMPSEADRQLTKRIADALRTIDVRLLDHVVCGAGEFYSFADHRENSLLR